MNVRIYSAFIAAIVLFCSTVVRADLSNVAWKKGQLTTWNNGVEEGELSYNWSAETVLLRQPDGHIHAYSAQQVRQFGWFDYDYHKYRTFMSLANTNKPMTMSFYEICMDGQLTVIRHLRRSHGLLKRAFNHPNDYSDNQRFNQNTDQFDYYVYDEGKFRRFDRFYLDIYEPLLMNHNEEIKKYIRVHNIDERTLMGRLVMIHQYNFLAQQDQKTASIRSEASKGQ
jgi:hypothetical protein